MLDNEIETYIDDKIKKVREDIARIGGKNNVTRNKTLHDIFKKLDSSKTQCSTDIDS